MTWLQTTPAANGRWDLVFTHAKRLGVLTKHLLQELERVGAQPKFIGNAWMVLAQEFAQVEDKLQLTPTRSAFDAQLREIAQLRAQLSAAEAQLKAAGISINQIKE